MNKTLLAAITEKAFMQQVIELARIHDWLVYHAYNSRRSAPGFPDLVLARDSFVIFAELKTEKGNLSTQQQKWADTLTSDAPTTHIYREWRPSNWNDIEEALK